MVQMRFGSFSRLVSEPYLLIQLMLMSLAAVLTGALSLGQLRNKQTLLSLPNTSNWNIGRSRGFPENSLLKSIVVDKEKVCRQDQNFDMLLNQRWRVLIFSGIVGTQETTE